MQGEAATRLAFTDLLIGEGPRGRRAGRRAPGVLWGLSYFCGVASRTRASAGPLEDEQRVANQDPKNRAQMKASTGSHDPTPLGEQVIRIATTLARRSIRS